MALVCNGYMLAGRSRDGLRRCHHQKSMDAPVGNVTVVSDPVIPAKTGTRNCSASSASAGQYAIASAAIAGMTAEFFSGIGAQDRTFGTDSSVSQVMAG